MHWDLLTAALVIAGWLAVWISSRRTLQSARAELQCQIDSLSASVKALEQAANARTAAAPVAVSGTMEAPTGTAPATTPAQASEQITPETLAKITETITALLGRKVHIRSVKMLPTPNAIGNPWAQQGRVVVQASHQLASRRREP